VIGDRVLDLLPFGPVGRVVKRLVIRRQLRAIFAHRHRVIAGRFGGDPACD